MVASNNHASRDRSNLLIAITNVFALPCHPLPYHTVCVSRATACTQPNYPLIVYSNEVISMEFIV
jgi:hypothetical protein